MKGAKMEIKKLIKQCHENAVKKGFYDCPECQGKGKIKELGIDIGNYICQYCKGRGKDLYRDKAQMIMLIISEIGEAQEAHRKGKFTNPEVLDDFLNNIPDAGWIADFYENIKDTFEDEIADIFIRLFDFCGYFKIKDIDHLYSKFKTEDIKLFKNNSLQELFIFACAYLCDFYKNIINWLPIDDKLQMFFNVMMAICEQENIEIEKHIKLKLEYNRFRPYKHGKKY
jgi:NTP pyrophosphatase (non-canonical NTP hydrolase)